MDLSSDEKIIYNKLKQNDRTAVEKVYVESFPIIRGLLKKKGNKFLSFEDFYQDVFMIFLKNIKNGQFVYIGAKLSTYLYGIAERQLNQSFKNAKQYVGISEIEERHALLESYENDYEDLNQVLEQIMQKLDEVCRQLLVMVYYHKLNHAEIAEKMGFKNANTVKSKKNKCMDRARNLANELSKS